MVRQEVLAPLARQIQPVLATFVPATARLTLAELGPVLARVDARLTDEPAALQRQLRLFVRVLWWLPVFTYFKTLGGLTAEQRERFLTAMQDSRLTKLRLGIWGLRTLLFLGWYGDPAVQAKLGYRPNIGGWDAWRAQRQGGGQ